MTLAFRKSPYQILGFGTLVLAGVMAYGAAGAEDTVVPGGDTARYLRLHDEATRTGAVLAAEPAPHSAAESCVRKAQQPRLEPRQEGRG